ncbi:MAG: hypothetical protein HRU20_05845 [Pseudomonadales bacterium]|nr:hypothetical protein [Pseudomonadales bacterium]
MFKNLISLAIIAAVGYWYWNGPYQDKVNPSYTQKVEQNEKDLAACERGKSYISGAGGKSDGDPETACAKKLNLYFADGHWHSYDDVRPD